MLIYVEPKYQTYLMSYRNCLHFSNEFAVNNDNDVVPHLTARMLLSKFQIDDNEQNLHAFSDSHRVYDPMMYTSFFMAA